MMVALAFETAWFIVLCKQGALREVGMGVLRAHVGSTCVNLSSTVRVSDGQQLDWG